MSDFIFVRRRGAGLARVRVERPNRRRRAAIAQAMRGAGWTDARIAQALAFPPDKAAGLFCGLFGEFRGAIAQAMREI